MHGKPSLILGRNSHIAVNLKAAALALLLLLPLQAFCYYNPNMGKWLTRDPIEEKGDVNIYASFRNNAPGHIDVLGLYYDTYSNLTPAERAFCRKNICCCWKTKHIPHAIHLEHKKHFHDSDTADGTALNAVQHCAWMCATAGVCGKEFAKGLGDAHEDRPGNDGIDRKMDLANNQKGLALGTPGVSVKQCYDACYKLAQDRQLLWYDLTSEHTENRWERPPTMSSE